MRDVYRAFFNRVGTDRALALAHDLDRWHGRMEPHRDEILRLGFAPDGHPQWEDCPHAEARRLWVRALDVLGSRAGELEFLRACSWPSPPAHPQSSAPRPSPAEKVEHAA